MKQYGAAVCPSTWGTRPDMTKEKQPKIHPKSDRRYNWYLEFKKREEDAKKGADDKQTVDARTES